MAIYVKVKKDNVVKEIDANFLADYISAGWEEVVEETTTSSYTIK